MQRPSLWAPGVYAYEVPSEIKPIEAIGTSTAAFVGPTPEGPYVPTRISSMDRYRWEFDPSNPERDQPGAMELALLSFFQNGGRVAYVARVEIASSSPKASATIVSRGPGGGNLLKIEARTAHAADLVLRLSPQGADTTVEHGTFALSIGRMVGGVYQALEYIGGLSFRPKNGDDSDNPNYIVTRVAAESTKITISFASDLDDTNPTEITGSNIAHVVESGRLEPAPALDALVGKKLRISGSEHVFAAPLRDMKELASQLETALPVGAFFADGRLVLTSANAITLDGSDVDVLEALQLGPHGGRSGAGALLSTIALEAVLTGGHAGGDGSATEYASALEALEKVDVGIVCLPTQQLAADGTGNDAIAAAIAHAEKLKNRVVIVDPPTGELTQPETVLQGLTKRSDYAVLYYPWITTGNPRYREESDAPRELDVPPSAFVAGVWARTDAARGVWKAPAGVQTGLIGVRKLVHTVDDTEQELLNPLGANCIRAMPGYGTVVWGSRTLATKADPPWRYLPVRRTAIMLRESIRRAIQWAVFEPNDEKLWSSLRINVEAFMNGLFQSGAFQGKRASDAYRVRCGMPDTMTIDDVNAGYAIVWVEFAPVKPAEFVVVMIQQKVASQ